MNRKKISSKTKMDSIKLSCLLFVCMAALYNEVSGQQVERGCQFDGKIYKTARSYIRSKTGSRNTCRQSFVIPRRASKIVETLEFFDLAINCNGRNNLILKDAAGKTFDYCASAQESSFTFTSNSDYVGIIKQGKTLAYFSISLTTEGNVVVPTNPPTAPSTVPTNPPVDQSTPPPVVVNQGQCGVPQLANNREGLMFKIVGGTDVTPGAWPWQVYISDGNYICGATLINNQWLVTAAHCDFDLSSWYAYLGDHNIRILDGETRIRVVDFIQHEDYNSRTIDNDIALLRLETNVTFTDKIQPACLPGGRVDDESAQGVVTGWGTTSEGGRVSNILQQASITVLNPSECGNDNSLTICAGEIRPIIRDSCQGDSGGPFVVKDSITNAYYLSGVVSNGVGCRGRGVYTRVSAYEQWIQDTIENY